MNKIDKKNSSHHKSDDVAMKKNNIDFEKDLSLRLKNDLNNHDGNKIILDIPIKITVELGTKKIKIKDIFNFSKGTMLSLNQNKSDPLKIFANNVLIALGEIVILDNQYGIRITSINKNFNPVNI